MSYSECDNIGLKVRTTSHGTKYVIQFELHDALKKYGYTVLDFYKTCRPTEIELDSLICFLWFEIEMGLAAMHRVAAEKERKANNIFM